MRLISSDIIKQLNLWGIIGNMLILIKIFLNNRSFKVRVNGILTELKYIENGTQQGSALSETLFLITINDIPKKHKISN